MRKIKMLALALILSTAAMAQTTWNIDKKHSRISFSVTHMVVSETEGNFKDFDAKVVSASNDFNGADVTFTAKVASINTENDYRDGHLKSADFFDAEKFPEVKFTGKIVKEGDKYLLKGKFTMKETTKDVTFDLKFGGTLDTGKGKKAGFKVTGTVNRQEYGVSWANKMASGEAVVSDEVAITCKIELDEEVAK